MAVTITSPQSQVVKGGNITFSWTSNYPQTAYEILWRKKGESAWNTFGRVTSSTQSTQLNSNSFELFVEYHYAIVVYADNASSGSSIYNGSDHSAAYSLIVVPSSDSIYMKISTGQGMVEVPFYINEFDESTTKRPVARADGSGIQGSIAGIVNVDAANASNARVRFNGETRALAKDTNITFQPTGQSAYAYMQVRYSYSQNQTAYGYTKYTNTQYQRYQYSAYGSYRYTHNYTYWAYAYVYKRDPTTGKYYHYYKPYKASDWDYDYSYYRYYRYGYTRYNTYGYSRYTYYTTTTGYAYYTKYV